MQRTWKKQIRLIKLEIPIFRSYTVVSRVGSLTHRFDVSYSDILIKRFFQNPSTNMAVNFAREIFVLSFVPFLEKRNRKDFRNWAFS